MAQLTHEQYDALERAVVKGMRVAIYRSGRRESRRSPDAERARRPAAPGSARRIAPPRRSTGC